MADRVFLREVHLDTLDKTLLFYQNSVGNVSAVVWDAALVLATYINKTMRLNPSWLPACKVVELGSGLGCCGVTAACFGADVVLTDLVDVVPQLLRTIELNRGPISDGNGKAVAVELKWGSNVQPILDVWGQPPDLILMSDCVYYEESLQPLLDTLRALCPPRKQILISQEFRDTGRQEFFIGTFLRYLSETFDIIEVVDDLDEVYRSKDIHVYLATKRAFPSDGEDRKPTV